MECYSMLKSQVPYAEEGRRCYRDNFAFKGGVVPGVVLKTVAENSPHFVHDTFSDNFLLILDIFLIVYQKDDPLININYIQV